MAARGFIAKLAGIALAMTAPLWVILAFKWPISTDLLFYAASLKSFSLQFWASEMYPRWLIDTNDGLGSPVFLFYSPLSFYFMSLLQFLSPLDPHGFGRIFLGLTAALITGGIACYRWLKLALPQAQAERGALIYAGFPYLALFIYGGFAVPQLWGVALFPFLLEAAHNVTQKGARAIPKLAIAYTLLAMTHLPSLLVFGAVPILYVCAFSARPNRWPYTAASVFAAFLGGCISAIYLVPALKNKSFINTGHFLNGDLFYAHNFFHVFSALGIISILLPLLVFYLEMPRDSRAGMRTRAIRFWLLITAGLFFMTTPLSKPLWDLLPPLQHLQFPFRFFFAMLPGAVFIAVQWLPYARSRRMYEMLFALAVVTAAVYSSEVTFFARKSPAASILEYNLLARPEYQTKWMAEQGADLQVRLPEQFRDVKPVRFVKGKGKATLTSQGGRSMTLHVSIDSPEAALALKRFYFPGWKASPDTVAVEERGALLALRAPKGSYDIKLTLPWFAGEREGMIISLFALMVLMGWLGLSGLRMQPKGLINSGSSTSHA